MSLRKMLEELKSIYWSNDTVMFKPIKTEAELIYAAYECQLFEYQKDLVNPAWFSIGRAYLFPQNNYPCLICKISGEPIGFINLSKWLKDGDNYSWSFFIDKDYQGKGYGKKAAQLAINIFKTVDPSITIKLATEKDNLKAQSLYKSLGFKKLIELDGDDLVFGL